VKTLNNQRLNQLAVIDSEALNEEKYQYDEEEDGYVIDDERAETVTPPEASQEETNNEAISTGPVSLSSRSSLSSPPVSAFHSISLSSSSQIASKRAMSLLEPSAKRQPVPSSPVPSLRQSVPSSPVHSLNSPPPMSASAKRRKIGTEIRDTSQTMETWIILESQDRKERLEQQRLEHQQWREQQRQDLEERRQERIAAERRQEAADRRHEAAERRHEEFMAYLMGRRQPPSTSPIPPSTT
jgi:hypothetical protein